MDLHTPLSKNSGFLCCSTKLRFCFLQIAFFILQADITEYSKNVLIT